MKKIILFLFLLISISNGQFLNMKFKNKILDKRVDIFNKKIEDIKKNKSKLIQVSEINKLFNRSISYASDLEVYKVEDHIASFEETIVSMKGDCDDYVMAKYQALMYIGGFDSIYRIYSEEKGVPHVKLVVSFENQHIVLDNSNKKLRRYSLAEGKNIFQMGKYRIIAANGKK